MTMGWGRRISGLDVTRSEAKNFGVQRVRSFADAQDDNGEGDSQG